MGAAVLFFTLIPVILGVIFGPLVGVLAAVAVIALIAASAN